MIFDRNMKYLPISKSSIEIRVLYFVLAFLKLIQEKGAHSTLVLRKSQFSDSFG